MTMQKDELEFKAEFMHNRDVALKTEQGRHLPGFHNTPYKVPPPLRDDGKTYCHLCDLSMQKWELLDDMHKENYRRLVAAFAVADEEFKKVNPLAQDVGPANKGKGASKRKKGTASRI